MTSKKEQLWTSNVSTDDEENPNSTDLGGDLLLAYKLKTVSQRTTRMPQGNKRNRKSTVHRSRHF